MYRRIVSLLLVPCVLLTQSVAVFAHAHEGGRHAGRKLRPHFHTKLLSAASGHDHGHHHHGPHGHHHHHHGDEAPASQTEPAQQPEPLSQHEHDSDAIYVNHIDFAVNSRSAVEIDLAAWLEWTTLGLPQPTEFCADPLCKAVNWMHPPPSSGYACALYVWQHALLI